jgi:hypothetical protein
MNERIKTLAKVAGYDEINKAAMKLIGFDLEKFAELIVKECVEVCHKMAEDSDSYVVHDGDTCAEQIKKHFGVEE